MLTEEHDVLRRRWYNRKEQRARSGNVGIDALIYMAYCQLRGRFGGRPCIVGCVDVYQLEFRFVSTTAHPWAHVLWKVVSQRRSSLESQPDSLAVFSSPCLPLLRTELIRRMKRFQVANHACLMIKYAKDKRYDQNGVATHDRSALLSVSLWAAHACLCHDVCVFGSVQASDIGCVSY